MFFLGGKTNRAHQKSDQVRAQLMEEGIQAR